jgi:hypothetical protein
MYAFVISTPGGYFLVRLVNYAGFIQYQQRFEWYQHAQANAFCDMLNNLASWNAGKGIK